MLPCGGGVNLHRASYRQAQDGVIAEESLPVGNWRRYFHEIYTLMHQSWAEFQLSVPQEVECIQWTE